ncbi:hypothetical protein N7495_004797 [Penicillium taxi]|uniref:uncharacterized protein n=1 Tax=Penicillium taxi TaxID=168475 RepID=UPI00254539D1|nr:uncharacterized protein N7495_004797 [Penicillium taxi]KAJ5900053.1 hypothetical protein N7495_004797 [Penicillium taxi]
MGSNSSIANLRTDQNAECDRAQHQENNMTGHYVDQDCLLAVMDLFSELEVPTERIRHLSSIDASQLNLTAQTITAVFRRLSTILICPCSERTEIGMLISAICMTIIDIHAMTLAKSAFNNPSPTHPTVIRDDHGAIAQESPENEATAMRVLRELSKVAKLVLQFTERYCGDDRGPQVHLEGNGMPLEILPTLASLIRERLHKITSDATYWLR